MKRTTHYTHITLALGVFLVAITVSGCVQKIGGNVNSEEKQVNQSCTTDTECELQRMQKIIDERNDEKSVNQNRIQNDNRAYDDTQRWGGKYDF